MFTMEEDQAARVLVVPAGEIGVRAAARIAGRLPHLSYLSGSATFDELSRTAGEADMMIIVSGLENEAAAARAARSAAAAAESAPCQVTIALVAKTSVSGSSEALISMEALRLSVDALFQVSGASLFAGDESAPQVATPGSVEEYLVRLVATTIARMTTESGLICLDYADIRAIMSEGGSGAFVGIGISQNAGEAAGRALQALSRQGMEPEWSPGVLVAVCGSTNMTMDQFDAASGIIHRAIDKEANIIAGILIDDELAGNIRVVVMLKDGVQREFEV
jgi:cell division protein FtsZ